jgi:plastocyanin
MSRPGGTAPASMAGFGICALLAAIALSGWNPARRIDRAWAAHSRGSSSCPHAGSRRRRAKVEHASRRRAPKHCPKAPRHTTTPQRRAHPEGGSVGAGSPGTADTPTVPAGSTPPAKQPGSGEAPTPPPSLPEVQVSAVEYRFTLSRTTVPAGKVILEFVNNGQDEHNLNAQGSTGPPAATFANADPKAVVRQVVELRPGSYTLFCSLADHEQKGMKATLTVE